MILEEPFLDKMRVRDIRHLIIEKPTLVREDAALDTLFPKILQDPRTRHIYVVNDNRILVGSIRLNGLVEYLFPLMLTKSSFNLASRLLKNFNARVAGDIMNRHPSFVMEQTPIPDMVAIMHRDLANELPVVDDQKRVIGEVNAFELILAYIQNRREATTEMAFA